MMISLHKYLDDRTEESIRILQELVRIPTVNPPGERYSQMIDLLFNICKGIGLEAEIYVVPDSVVKNHK